MTNSTIKSKPSWRTNWILLGTGITLGLVIGIVALQWLFFNGDRLDQTTTQATRIIENQKDGGLADVQSSDSHTANSLNDVRSLKPLLASTSRVNQDLVLYNLVYAATESQLRNLLNESKQVTSKQTRQTIQKVLIQRFAMLAPKQALSLIEEQSLTPRQSLLEWVFQEWSLRNMDQAVTAALELEAQDKQVALIVVFNARTDLSHKDHLRIAKKFGYEQLVSERILLTFLNDERIDPEVAWEQIKQTLPKAGSTLSKVQQEVIAKIAQEWFTQQGEHSLEEVKKYLQRSPHYTDTMAIILANIGLENPLIALQLAETFKLYSLKVKSKIVESAAVHDPNAALNAASKMASLTTRDHLQRVAITSWIETDAEVVLENLLVVPENLRSWTQQEALLALAHESHAFVASYIPSIEDDSVKNRVSLVLAWRWAKADPLAALNWAQSNPDVSMLSTQLQTRVIQTITQDDPQLALQLAFEQPLAEEEIGLEAFVIGAMMNVDIDAALGALDKARNEATKNAAFVEVGITLVRKGRSATAMEIVKELSPDFQRRYFSSLGTEWAYTEPDDLFQKLEALPTDQIRENLASQLAMMSDLVQLTTEQKEKLKEYVPPALHGALQ